MKAACMSIPGVTWSIVSNNQVFVTPVKNAAINAALTTPTTNWNVRIAMSRVKREASTND